MSSLQYWLGGIFVLIISMVFMSYNFLVHTSNVDSTEQVDMSEGNMSLGVFRGEVDDEGTVNSAYSTLDIKEIEDNIISSIALKQKSFRNDIKILYTFIDKDGNEVDTSIEENIPKVRGVHYGVISIENNKSINLQKGIKDADPIQLDVSVSDRVEIQNIATEQE